MTPIATKDPRFFLRHATAEDAGLVLAYMQKLGAYQRMADEITATEASIYRLLAANHAEAVLAIWDDEPVGMMLFSATCSAFTGRSGLYIDAFVLDETLRARGLGRIMMAYLSKLALQRGGQMLEWGCLDWNTPAIGFYKKMGAYCLDIMHIYRLSPEDLQSSADAFQTPLAKRR